MEIIGSFLLAILQSILFYGKEIGISMLIFLSIVNGILYYILKRRDKIKNKNGFVLIIPILLLSSTYFIFANKIFYIANIFILLGLSFIMYIMVTNKKDELKKHLCHALELLGDTLSNCEEAIKYTKEKSSISNSKIDKSKIKKIAISLLIVVFVIGVILILLASADSIFANLFSGIEDIFRNVTIGSVFSLVIRIVIFVGVYIVFLSFLLNVQREYKREEEILQKKSPKDNFTIKLLLVTVNIVYLVFCYIQIKSLFANINIDETFNYANYARSGFFQLMFVSFINFAIILISNKYNVKKEKIIRISNTFLVIFTVIIALSSMYRMHMYEMEYGLTYLRTFVYIILITEIALLIPMIVYIINEKFKIMKWSFMIGICIYCSINYIQIEKIIVNNNINIKTSAVETDYKYIAKIASEDSYEILEEKLKEERSSLDELEITKLLLKIKYETKGMEWQEFNFSKWKAQEKKIDRKRAEEEIVRLQNKIREEEKINEKVSGKPENYIYNEAINENEEYFVEKIDSATGTDVWSITKITEKGEKFTQINKINVSSASKIKFFENGLGFLEEPTNIYGKKSELFVTHDSGKTFEKVNLPEGTFTLSYTNEKSWKEYYDYFHLPTKDANGLLIAFASAGEGDTYNQGRTRAKYISNDKGYTWQFVEEVWKE